MVVPALGVRLPDLNHSVIQRNSFPVEHANDETYPFSFGGRTCNAAYRMRRGTAEMKKGPDSLGGRWKQIRTISQTG
jgi:hypothetical protein